MSRASAPPRAARLERLCGVLEREGLDAAALVPGSNFTYLTGSVHHLMERPLVLLVRRDGAAAVVIPRLEHGPFAAAGFEARAFPWSDADGPDGALRAAVAALDLAGARIGLEGQTMRLFEARALERAAEGAELVDAHAALSSVRAVKEPGEIDALRAAVALSEEALRRTLEAVSVGMTEAAVLGLLSRAMADLGSEPLAFGPLVLAGANTANPHGTTRSDYALRRGDPLLFDFGATQGGFSADITRTVFVGEPTARMRAVYAAVAEANETGRRLARPGLTGRDLDAAVTRTLHDAGFGAFVLHRTGHGLGLDVHEAPYLSAENGEPLEAGNVVTIEPGLYEAGVVGVRIEDDVVVTEGGSESLTTFPREVLVVG